MQTRQVEGVWAHDGAFGGQSVCRRVTLGQHSLAAFKVALAVVCTVCLFCMLQVVVHGHVLWWWVREGPLT